jgi:L-threonylcarbamoyladenylate synthase
MPAAPKQSHVGDDLKMSAALSSKSRTFKIDPAAISSEALGWAASVLKAGGLVVYPTETFYAIGATPADARAVNRAFEAKGRDFGKPLPLIASDREAALRAAAQWPEAAEALARTFWPGALSIIVPAAAFLPPALHAGTGKIAIRVSSHPVSSLVARAAGGLIVSTSANTAGEPPPSRPGDIGDELLRLAGAFLDAGDLPGALPSTIVDVTVRPAALIRAGVVPWEEVRRAFETSVSGSGQTRPPKEVERQNR